MQRKPAYTRLITRLAVCSKHLASSQIIYLFINTNILTTVCNMRSPNSQSTNNCT